MSGRQDPRPPFAEIRKQSDRLHLHCKWYRNHGHIPPWKESIFPRERIGRIGDAAFFQRNHSERCVGPFHRAWTMKKLLYIDLFCGAGGTSTGVDAVETHVATALCVSLYQEINHINLVS